MSQHRSRLYRVRLAVLATPAILTVPAYLQAQSIFTASPTGDWTVDANWSPTGAPNNTSIDVTISDAATAVVSDADNVSAHKLLLGVHGTGSGTGTLSITSNGIYSGNAVATVGSGGTGGAGTLLNNGSFSNTQNLILGNGSGSTGTIIMSGGTLSLINTAVVNIGIGQTGSGTILQNGGFISLPSMGTFGLGRGGTGYYDMEGGSLVVGGIFQMSTSGTGIGTFIQNAGSITANSASIGLNGAATCTIGGGSFIVNTGMLLSSSVGSTATFTQNNAEFVSTGTLDVGIGTTSVTNFGVATYTLSSGTLSIGTNMFVGGSSATTGAGTFIHTGGNLIVGGNLTVGAGTSSSGTMNVSGNGSISLTPTSTVSVGTTGSGTFNLCTTGTGTATLSAGTIQVGSVSTGSEVDGQFLMGSTTVAGALPTVTVGTVDFGLTNNATGPASTRLFSISSGTLNAGLVDLTSYNEPGGTSPNQATFQQLGGTGLVTTNIGSMTFAGGVYQVGGATAAPTVVNSAALSVNQTGTILLPSLATASFTGGGTIACVGSLTLNGALTNNGAVLNVGAATNGTGTVSFRGAQTNLAGSGLTVNSGQLNLQTNGGSLLTLTAGNTAKAVIGGGTFTNATTNATENLGTVSILGGGVVRLFSASPFMPSFTPAVLLHAGTLSIHADISGASAGTLDVAGDDAIIDNGVLATIQAQVKSGYASGSWNGPGIRSSVALAKPGTVGIGYATLSEIATTTFDGVSTQIDQTTALPSTAVLLKYTLLGDANLDGTVNALDFNALATNYGKSGEDWSQGDFNYSSDGTVDSTDFALLAANFGGNVAALGADVPDAAPAAALGTLVPEPMSLSLVALSGIGLIQRRRRL